MNLQRRVIGCLAFSLILAVAGCASKSSTKSSSSRAKGFQIRSFETQTLDNGLTIIWIRDAALPYVSYQMMLKSGSAQDPKGKEGVAAFTAHMLSKGAGKRSALQIADDLQQIGADFDADVNPDYTTVSASSLSFYKRDLLELYTSLIIQPTFPEAELERERKNALASLQKLADKPESFAEYLFPRFFFGSHPYGHVPMGFSKSIKRITRQDLKAFYAANYVPNNAVLAVTGQFDEEWRKEVVTAFSQWKVGLPVKHQLPDFPDWKGLDILLVDRADLNQAQIQIGFKGVPRNFPEYLELRAALKILGESFGSRLFDEIREKRGLTYHIRAWFDPRQIAGPMGIYTFTRTDKINEMITETLKVYRDFVSQGVTDAEVREVRALMRGQFPRMFETPESLASQLLLLNRYGVSVEYLTNYFVSVDALTRDGINATIQKYFDPANLKILVYAPRSKAEASLKPLGNLEVKNYKDML